MICVHSIFAQSLLWTSSVVHDNYAKIHEYLEFPCNKINAKSSFKLSQIFHTLKITSYTVFLCMSNAIQMHGILRTISVYVCIMLYNYTFVRKYASLCCDSHDFYLNKMEFKWDKYKGYYVF